MSEALKETKAQRVERLKREQNPWEAYADIQRFAREGWDSVPPEWLGTYFRWWGIYTQGDGVGAIGGKGGEGKAVRHFMVRIRIPNGVLESRQVRTIADLADRHGRGVADITVRQNFQLHWVTLDALPDVFQALWLQGVTTMGSCGDVTRNVTGCPVAGLDAEELIDASPLVLEATALVNGNAAFYNLPRKFKVSISGCRAWCAYPEINDIGLTAVRHPSSGEVGFAVRVGGGLSTDPHLGVRLDAFVPRARVLDVFRAIAEIFRDSDVLRQNRERARLKFLFLLHGWTAERFKAAIEERLGAPLAPGVPDDPPDDAYRDHVGIHAQQQPGYCYVGVAVLRGRVTADQMRIAADLADRYGTGAVRTTSMQNFLIPNVRRERAHALARELEGAGFARGLVESLEQRLPGFDQQLRINVTGCPNSCGQHWIADLGIEGKKVKVDGAMVDAYYFCVGGAVGRHQAVARPIGLRLPATAVAAAIERLLRAFQADRRPAENFRQFAARHTDEELRGLLAGELVEAAGRDSAAERPPHGVDG